MLTRCRLAVLLAIVLMGASCASMQSMKKDTAVMKAPELNLESFQVTQYDGYWYYSKDIEPTKGEAGDHGAPLPMSFLFTVDNPNPYAVKLEGLRFSVAFEGFELITVKNDDTYWIPGQTTDQVRVNTLITTRSALLSLLVTGGFDLQEKGWTPWQALERWWTKVPVMEVPVKVKDGSATFAVQEQREVVPFEFVYPQETEE